jgi:hypothetical protein
MDVLKESIHVEFSVRGRLLAPTLLKYFDAV